MRYVEAGGVRVSAIGLGTWQFGTGEWGYGLDSAATKAVERGVAGLDPTLQGLTLTSTTVR